MCGSGGVGKTTLAAALGLAAAAEQVGDVRVDRRPGAPPGRCVRSRQARQCGDAGALMKFCGRSGFRRTRRAVGGDARHQGRVGTSRPRRHVPTGQVRVQCRRNRLSAASRAVRDSDDAPPNGSSWTRLHVGVYDLVGSDARPRATLLTFSTGGSRMVDFFGSRLSCCCTRAGVGRALFNLASRPSTRSPTGFSGSGSSRTSPSLVLSRGDGRGFATRAREGRGVARRSPASTFIVVTTLEARPPT